ncbi:hypothetical protein N0V94_005388 [Neodidymelliopsis sp. IMI 364377]|nr:hypothetical protein N0V94_005388 [Neodidymelliopsis sp. IMI 364377]
MAISFMTPAVNHSTPARPFAISTVNPSATPSGEPVAVPAVKLSMTAAIKPFVVPTATYFATPTASPSATSPFATPAAGSSAITTTKPFAIPAARPSSASLTSVNPSPPSSPPYPGYPSLDECVTAEREAVWQSKRKRHRDNQDNQDKTGDGKKVKTVAHEQQEHNDDAQRSSDHLSASSHQHGEAVLVPIGPVLPMLSLYLEQVERTRLVNGHAGSVESCFAKVKITGQCIPGPIAWKAIILPLDQECFDEGEGVSKIHI